MTRKKYVLQFLTTESFKQHAVFPSNRQVDYSSARES